MPKAGAARRAEAQWIPVNATTLELTKEENEGKTFEVRAGHVPTFMPSSTEEMNAKFAVGHTIYTNWWKGRDTSRPHKAMIYKRFEGRMRYIASLPQRIFATDV